MKEVTDLWFASYLKCNGFKVIDYNVIRRGKGSYTFEISEEDYKKNKLDYFNSDLSKIKQIMEELKDLCY